ncbi:MAG: NUDIX domain-containing protein [Chloroflexi bacterium]|nr:MAG: NUDIX domain-containing protein [Chloroflexota bacterium]
MSGITVKWKRRVARVVQIPLVRHLMLWGIRVVVPRHRVGVAVVLLDDDERVLLLRHVFHPSTPWGLPGGWLGGHESPADGALRELKEETGLTAVLGPTIHVTYGVNPSHIGIAYLGKLTSHQITLSPEIIEARWFPIDNLPTPMLPFTIGAIHAAHRYQQVLHILQPYWYPQQNRVPQEEKITHE